MLEPHEVASTIPKLQITYQDLPFISRTHTQEYLYKV